MRRHRIACVVGLWIATCALAATAEIAALPGAEPFDPALAKRLAAAAAELPRSEVRTKHRLDDGAPRFTNRLILEQSPYLLQHAHNPVNWYPWGDEAFATAKRLGRPVLLSIGYATCHWCHVMEEESYDDPEIARLLNESFVAIKVDREVRPDVDATYMTAIQLLGERGGWPLNVFLTPDRKPFHAGTYYPPEDRHGRPGFPRVLAALRDLYAKEPDRVAREAQRVTDALREALAPAQVGEAEIPERDLIDRAIADYAERYDPEWGGIASRTKFPGALPIRLLLRADGDSSAGADGLAMATHTLEVIARSGLRDHVGGGFHRYTTDPHWQVPHFEKMLYDNARLVLAYLEAWQKTGRTEFADVARDTASMLLRDFAVPEGGFLSASDADSRAPDGELVEGFYFTWTRDELEAVLGADDAAVAAHWYDVGVEPFVEERSVLRTPHSADSGAERADMDVAAFRERLARIRARLATARAERPPPLVDRKILTAWNGLAISALARTGFSLGEPAFVAAAARAARVVLAGRDESGRLRRVLFQGEASGVAFLEDYALMIAALLDLYESEGESDPEWLAAAIALQQRQEEDFGDAAGGGYFRTADGGEAMLVRDKPFIDDGTLPSSNGVAVSNLLRLAALTAEDAHLERADRAFSAFGDALAEGPTRAPTLLLALDWRHDLAQEVILVLPETGGDAAPLLDVLRRVHQPNRVVAVVREGKHLAANAEWVSLVAGKKASRGEPTAYVCENRTCRFPTRDPAELERQLLRQSEADGVTR